MQFSLNTASETLISEIMASGVYENPDDAVTDALTMLHESLRERADYLGTELQKGIDQIDRGETVPYNLEKIKGLASERVRQGLGYTRENSAAIPPIAN
jgi:Arc/MetJ-type ribon-helix-helix transcriptional regulator